MCDLTEDDWKLLKESLWHAIYAKKILIESISDIPVFVLADDVVQKRSLKFQKQELQKLEILYGKLVLSTTLEG